MDTKLKDGVLTITVTLDEPGSLSSTGKSYVVASTHGNVLIPGTDLKMGLNVYRPVKRAQ